MPGFVISLAQQSAESVSMEIDRQSTTARDAAHQYA
jgi:hypothetical protein